MLAVFKTGGKQFSVKAGQILKVEKLEGSQGDSVSFNDVLAISDASDHTIGKPIIKGATIDVFEPTKTLSFIIVLFFFLPS